MRTYNFLLIPAVFIAALLKSVTWAAPAPGLEPELAAVQHDWADIKYQRPETEQLSRLEALAGRAHAVSQRYPERAEPRVWEAIVLSTYAGAKGGFGALGLVKQARELLLEAERIDPDALDGSIYTTLGSLYYQVPGWPLGFGDDRTARQYLEKAIAADPGGLDANYFYADFLRERGEYAKAMAALQRALAAPPRPGREIADAGRRKEAEALIKRVRPFL